MVSKPKIKKYILILLFNACFTCLDAKQNVKYYFSYKNVIFMYFVKVLKFYKILFIVIIFFFH